jgi:hypothetical protein
VPACVLGLSFLLAGCNAFSDHTVVIATDLPEPECLRLEAAFRDWWLASPVSYRPPRITWLRGRPGEEPARLVEQGVGVDLMLGGSPAALQRLAEVGRLEGDDPPWSIVCDEITGEADLSPPFGDPRQDARTLQVAEALLAETPLPMGYAKLVRVLNHSMGKPSLANDPAVLVAKSERTECLAVVKSAPHGQLGRQFLNGLSRWRKRSPATEDFVFDPHAEPLLADLLGATVIDARTELVAALEALDRAKRAELETQWLVPPPWPPASIRKLSQKDPSGALVEELAAQIAPDLDLRIWLLENWSGPERPIDRMRLRSLALAVDGKLIKEPRFRAWLRGEWSSWARQNYRRIVRQLRSTPA